MKAKHVAGPPGGRSVKEWPMLPKSTSMVVIPLILASVLAGVQIEVHHQVRDEKISPKNLIKGGERQSNSILHLSMALNTRSLPAWLKPSNLHEGLDDAMEAVGAWL